MPTTPTKMSVPADAIAMLRADHKAVSELFEAFEGARSSEKKKALVAEICNELEVHTQLEEEIFYPAVKRVLKDKELVPEATIEHQSVKDLIAQLRECDYSRVPVWRGSADTIVGILHVRAVARCLNGPQALDRTILMTEVYEPYFVPESTPLHTQLANFQRERRRLGIVVDEYGSVRGLVTREDIIERVVGELIASSARDEGGITPTGDGAYLIEGTASVR